jgi:hypothetical protein
MIAIPNRFITRLLFAALILALIMLPTSQTAILAADSCTVIFDSMGGTPVDSVTTTCPGTITLPESPTRTGYQFLSWNPYKYGDGETLTESTIIRYSTIFYAQWQICSYTIRFVDWDDTLISEQIVKYQSNLLEPLNKPTLEGHLFAGWDKPVQSPAEDVTYKATYIPEPPKTITSSKFRITPDRFIMVPVGTTVEELCSGVDTPREFTTIIGENGQALLPTHVVCLNYSVKYRFSFFNGYQDFKRSDSLTVAVSGDLTGDSQIKDDDFRKLLYYLLDRGYLDSLCLETAKVDSDHVISALDLLLIKKYLLGQVDLH